MTVGIVLNDLGFQVVDANGVSAFTHLAKGVVEGSSIDISVGADEVATFVLEHLAVERIESVALIGGLDVEPVIWIRGQLSAPVVSLGDVVSCLYVSQQVGSVGNGRNVGFDGSNSCLSTIVVEFKIVEHAPAGSIGSIGLDADAEGSVGHFYGNGVLVLSVVEGIASAFAITWIAAIGIALQSSLGSIGIEFCYDAFACSWSVEALGTKLVDAVGKSGERLMNVVVRDP